MWQCLMAMVVTDNATINLLIESKNDNGRQASRTASNNKTTMIMSTTTTTHHGGSSGGKWAGTLAEVMEVRRGSKQ